MEENAVDVTVSGRVLNLIPQPGQALAEMRRVTLCERLPIQPNGTMPLVARARSARAVV